MIVRIIRPGFPDEVQQALRKQVVRTLLVADRTSLDDGLPGLPAQSVEGGLHFRSSAIGSSVASDLTKWLEHSRLP
jgi:hypothetical protein